MRPDFDPRAIPDQYGPDRSKRKDIHIAFYNEYAAQAAQRVPGFAGRVVRYALAVGHAAKHWKEEGAVNALRKAALPALALGLGIYFMPGIVAVAGMLTMGAGLYTANTIDKLATEMLDNDILKGNLLERYKEEIERPRTVKMLRENTKKLEQSGRLTGEFDHAADKPEPPEAPVGASPAPRKSGPAIPPVR